jgi:hypothetical protein
MGDMHVHDGADEYGPEAGGAGVSATAAAAATAAAETGAC